MTTPLPSADPIPAVCDHELAQLRAGMAQQRARVRLFRTALAEVGDSLSLIDPRAMRFIDFNDAACSLTGLSRDELLARGPAAAARMPAPELQAKYEDIIARHPEVVIEEENFVHPDGSDRVLEFSRRAVNADGRWLISVVARDITERKRSQARLERFASALDLSADALFLVDRETLTYLDFNQSACRLLGMTREELLKRRPNQTSSALGKLEDLGALYDRVIAQAPRVMIEELAVTRADGTQIPCEVHRQGLFSQGRWVIVANLRDISDRKLQQARIERFASLVNMSADAVFLIERESMRILDVNDAACRLYRFARADLLNLPLRRTLRQPSPQSDLEQQYDSLIAMSPRIVRVERTEVRSDGTTFPAESQRQAVFSGGQWIIAITVRDATERRRAEQEIARRVSELTRSNEELSEYAYALSHDLSEPLRTVASYTQLLERRLAGRLDESAREFMDAILAGAQRMRRLIDDLLKYASSGRSDYPMRLAGLDSLLDDALANLSSAIAQAGATIERGPLPTIECDQSMAQVFQNLIGNALKFRGDAAPRIRVGCAEEAEAWVLQVEDNGIGIAAEHFKRIFVLFQRLHPRGRYEGTGVGLAICKKIVERHGGWIEVDSQPGRGACFSVRLPKAAPGADPR
ncbi:MAG TPA: PAS domain S-box protein [Ramlibacter sp.]|uniref:PAS domain-containing sensor histidine kinase n=1 Tax=Ramlibacter sp. TaxID=1917967 RepID=UPI002B581703|nr:PAS domain S-box protein [Ramlibacter sp.]HVZ45056.1 PAS domain S-box protein [Ramlibacter sp.]